MNLNPCLTSYIKINSKYIKDLNLKARTTKLLEENIRVNLQKPGFGNCFLDMTSKHQQQKKKKKLDSKLLIKFLTNLRTPLVVQGLGVCLPGQGTWVRSLVQEDPPCHGATRSMQQNYCQVSQLLKPVCLELMPHKRNHYEKPTYNKE